MTTDVVSAEDRWLAVWAHRERLLRVASRRVADPAEAEDVVSEAVLRGARHYIAAAPHFDEAAGLAPWLTTITVNLCHETHRVRARAERVPAPVTYDPVTYDPVCDRVAVVVALGRLPERQRTAVALRAMGYDVHHIAQRLGCTYKTAESLLSRARAALRAALGEERQRRVV